jgi:hypothetical protein
VYLNLDCSDADIEALIQWLKRQRGRADREAATAYLVRKLNKYVEQLFTRVIIDNQRKPMECSNEAQRSSRRGGRYSAGTGRRRENQSR